MSRKLQRKNTTEVTSNIASALIDNKIKERYGTSINEFMSRDYNKKILKKVEDLRNEFESVGKDKNSFLSVDDVTYFFQEKYPQSRLTRKDFVNLFEKLGKTEDDQILVNDFVIGYVQLEERLKIEKIKIEKILDELKQQEIKFEQGKGRVEDERQISENLTNKSTVQVIVHQGLDMVGAPMSVSVDTFLTATLMETGEQLSTRVIQGKTNPKWNEELRFKVTKENMTLKIEGFAKGMVGTSSLGELTFQLNDFKDMKPKVKWYPLKESGTDKNSDKGKVFLKIHYVYNMNKYYDDELDEVNRTMRTLTDYKKELEDCLYNVDQPFGLITNNKIKKVFDDGLLGIADDILNNYEESRQDHFRFKKYEKDEFGAMKGIENFGKSLGQNIKWGNFTQIMMGLLLILTFISLLARMDFVNFGIAVFTWMCLFYDKNHDVTKLLSPLMKSIAFSLIYDFLFLIIQFDNFARGDKGDMDLTLKRVCYVIAMAIILVKLVLLMNLFSLKTKKEEANKGMM